MRRGEFRQRNRRERAGCEGEEDCVEIENEGQKVSRWTGTRG